MAAAVKRFADLAGVALGDIQARQIGHELTPLVEALDEAES